MPDLEKVLRGWERCKKCSMSPIAPQEAHEAYYECEYTIGLYCGKDKLEYETIALLKEQADEIERLKKPTAGDNQIPLRW